MKTYWTSILLSLTIKFVLSLEERPTPTICQKFSNVNRVTYELYCPSFGDQSLVFEIKPRTAKLTCQDNRLPLLDVKVNLKNITSLTIKGCELPLNITELFEAWNITDPEVIAFDNSKLPTGVISADLLRDFPKHNLTTLQFKKAGIEYVEESAFSGFDNLQVLDFEQNEITAVTDFFKHLPNLKRVDLQRNSIVDLPEVITAPTLTRLYLQSNKIENLTSNVFSQITNATTIELSSNNLKYIPEDVLKPLKKLGQVSFGLSGELNITSNFFRENPLLDTIKFRGGNITYIAPEAFDNLSRLDFLYIYDSNLRDLRLGTFAGTYALRRLNLGENRLSHLPDGIFENLKNLTDLDLTGNNLTSFSRSCHGGGLKSLRSLSLVRNDFEMVGPGSFVDLPMLETLILARNKIKHFQHGACDHPASVIKLDLSFNQLTDVGDYDFSDCVKLKDLNLRNNFFNEVPDLQTMTNLTLNLSNNNVTTLEVSTIVNFRSVDVSGNQIKHVSFFIVDAMYNKGQPYSLKLNINNNPIACDCSTYDLVRYFGGMQSKQIHNFIEIYADNTFCQGNHQDTPVKTLSLADLTCKTENCPENCNCTIFPANNTLEINCSNLNLTKPPENITFAPFRMASTPINKSIVILNNNRITNFDRNVRYENVTGLYLSNNNLNHIAWLPPKIEVLRLDNNAFTNIDEAGLSLLEHSEMLQSLTLHKNPWNCDCSLVPFTNAIRVNLTGKLESKHELRCADSEHNLYNLSEADLCGDSVIIPILYALLVIFLSLIAILMILYHIYEQSVKIWLYDRSIFLWFVTEEDLDKEKEYDAFVSYSHKDEDFIAKHLVPELERNKEDPYRLCIHNRDWIVGEFITLQIIESVKKSRRTIIVLSKNFMESTWAAMEFRTAYEEAMREKRNRLILIIYDDIDLSKIDDTELKNYIQTNTYIKWGDPWFWKRLRYAMPHKNRTKETKNTRIDNMMISIDEKIDLTDTPCTPNTQTPPAISGDPLLLKVSPLQFKLSKDGKETPPAECGMVATHIC